MILIFGLGNPGNQYKNTRHNFGWAVIDRLAEVLNTGDWTSEKRFKALVTEADLDGQKLVLVKPQTFMNRSGETVGAVSRYYKTGNNDILVIHDEADLLLGDIRLQCDRGDAGHNGVRSIMEQLGAKDFFRMRLGISSPKADQKTKAGNIVLENFSEEERTKAEEVKNEAVQQIIDFAKKNNPH